MSVIFERCSIRKYKDTPVPDVLIHEILKAGMAAPSAGGKKPWHFVVIKSKEVLQRIADEHPYGKMLSKCPVAIAVCADKTLSNFDVDFWPLDCSAATENILLHAVEKGLGAVWVSIYPREERIKLLKNLLGLPDNVIPVALVPMGYPAEKKVQSDCFDSSRIHLEKW